MSLPSPASLWELLELGPEDRIALVAPDSGVRLSYGALREQVRSVADRFASAGLLPGERIALALPNGIPATVCFLAASMAGTAAPLNPAYRLEEFNFYLEDTGAKILVVPPQGAEEARRAAGDRLPLVVAGLDPSGRVTVSLDRGPLSVPGPTPEQVALVLHTSGSTGRPKRVPLPHYNLSQAAKTVAETYRLSAGDVSLCVMPLFHVHGLVASVLAAFLSGGTVIVPARFNPLSFWRTVSDHRVTWYSAVPTIHQLLMARAGRSNQRPAGAEGLRFIRSCSAPLSAERMTRMEEVFGAPMLEAYGMTEASHQMASNPLPPLARLPGTVGRATGAELAIMDEGGHLLAAGQAGEVVVRGPSVIERYENNPDANLSSFVNGWFRTGDQGVLDQAGYLRLTGRLKEMINRGGEKISPLEVDELLLTHPAVAEAVCFGVAHDTWGEEVAAAVVLREASSEEALLAYCRERIADYKCPKKIHIVDQIPRTATGKIQRRAVAAAIAPAKA